jgi:hypothetical protein
MSESTNPIFTLLGWIHNIVYFYVRVLLPIVLSFCIGWTLIGMACNFGGSMGIAVPVFLIGIFIASYIIYGPKTFEYIKSAVKGTYEGVKKTPSKHANIMKLAVTSNPEKVAVKT